MALMITAAAPPSICDEILTITPEAFMTKASVNQANFTYRVLKLNKGNKDDLEKLILTV